MHVIDVVRYGLQRPLVIDVFDSGRIALVSCCSVPNVQGFFAWPPSNPACPMPSGEGSGARQIQADMPPISPRGMLSRWQSPDHLGNRAIGNTRRQTAVRGKAVPYRAACTHRGKIPDRVASHYVTAVSKTVGVSLFAYRSFHETPTQAVDLGSYHPVRRDT